MEIYINEDKALWKEVIVSKYGEASPWCTEMVTDTYGVGVWRTTRNLWQLMEDYLPQGWQWSKDKILER